MIPKIIWQTYETPYDQITDTMKEYSNSWKEKNPDWKHMYMSREDRENFVLHEFGEEWYHIFKNCELGVVQANIWRAMVIYKYGGVYTDFDAWCNEPIETWIKDDYSLTLAKDDAEPGNDICIIVFGGKPGSPALKAVIDAVKKNVENNKIVKKTVIELTGEILWTKILLGNDEKYNFYCYPLGSQMFNGKAASHLGTYKPWWKDGYIQWMIDGKHD